ncbi:2'-phosphotransferase [Marchantia polymorpha subsp. ruderalis]|uniref:2'-phosphotransferase n=2 Tax=Marchantia polymorpha TaxID=3197 RepID=A0AAF6BM09_MARPO|nr:hypothetical protein MARPO_0104s0031 [Marchantia polymorpha]BBN13043.1 hypothetical protein Mp_6g00350 [Marchantia polymorpha subsp. ruderalis]|eukprot:PTQ32002.1 hypothetical protein MARPO_0104s0031 [Marchantia polymorpha]
MLKGFYGGNWRRVSLSKYFIPEFLNFVNMENAWKSGKLNAGRGMPAVAGVPSSGTKSNSNVGMGVQGTSPATGPAQKRGSFGGGGASRSRLPVNNGGFEFQFGTVDHCSQADSDIPGTQAFVSPENKVAFQDLNGQTMELMKDMAEQVDKSDQRMGQSSQKAGLEKPYPPIRTMDQVDQQAGPSWRKEGSVYDSSTNQIVDERMTAAQPPEVFHPPAQRQPWVASVDKSNEQITSSFDDFPALGSTVVGGGGKRTKPRNQVVEPSKSERVIEAAEYSGRSEVRAWGSERTEPERAVQSNFKLGSGRGGGNWRESGGVGKDLINSLGRTMAKILRHQAVELKLDMRNDGYVDVKQLLSLSMRTASGQPMSSHTVDDVREAVKLDSKQRFGIKEEAGVLLIRANQGHSIKRVETEQLLKPMLTAEEVPACVHGTYRRHLPSIRKEGLKRMNRNHVHFAMGLSPDDGVVSGMRSTSEVLIYLDVSKALKDGMKLYVSENGVVLTEGFQGVVPPEYFKDIVQLPLRKK